MMLARLLNRVRWVAVVALGLLVWVLGAHEAVEWMLQHALLILVWVVLVWPLFSRLLDGEEMPRSSEKGVRR